MQDLMKKKEEQGSAIFFAVITLSLLFAIGMGVATLFSGELRILRGVGDSVVALNAGDSGVENVLYLDIQNCPASASVSEGGSFTSCSVSEKPCYPGCVSECVDEGSGVDPLICTKTIPVGVVFGNASSYDVDIVTPGTGNCPTMVGASTVHYCVESTGNFGDARRTIEVTR